MDFLLIALLTLLNGVFAMSEMALAASRRARLGAMAESGDKGAQAALKLMDDPTQFLSTVQVGITSIGMLNGIVGEAAFSGAVSQWLLRMGMTHNLAEVVATTVVIIGITFVTIIFGELVPKRIGQLFPEATARHIAQPMRWLALAANPFVRLLSATTAGILALLRINTTHARAVTEAEITASLDEGREAGLIEENEHQMVQNVFHLDDRSLSSMMVPRADVDWLEATSTVAQALTLVGTKGMHGSHSWYPVCRGGMDNVVGVISVGHLLSLGMAHVGAIESELEVPSYVPETLTGMELLEQFRAKAGRLVFVVDEYGVVQGLITPRDLLEAITGELRSDERSDDWAQHNADGSWVLAGAMPVAELKARLDIDELPEEEKGRYNTVAGLLMAVCGHLPMLGERIDLEPWQFEILNLDGRRIEKVRCCVHQPLTPSR